MKIQKTSKDWKNRQNKLIKTIAVVDDFVK